ncbi:MAG: radical SAM/SPASM domain-containing protein [Vicinamibacterales bacterium]
MSTPPPPRYVAAAAQTPAIALPSVVEVEVNSRCNRACSYCPVSVLPAPPVPTFMSDAVFEHLLTGLAEWRFDGRFSYHLYNEPLLRRDLERLARATASRLPDAHQVLYTNGDLLTPQRYQSLRDSGIAEFIVTRHDGDAERVAPRPRQTVLVPAQLQLTNRGGTLPTRRIALQTPLQTPCYAPSEMLIVAADGAVLLCYEDARRQHAMGNITERPLADIWTSPRFVELRARLAAGARAAAGGICAVCDNCAHDRAGTSWFAL